MGGVRCLNVTTGIGILESMVHSRAKYSTTLISFWPMKPYVFRSIFWKWATEVACLGGWCPELPPMVHLHTQEKQASLTFSPLCVQAKKSKCLKRVRSCLVFWRVRKPLEGDRHQDDPLTLVGLWHKIRGVGWEPHTIATELHSQLCEMTSISWLPFHANVNDIILTDSQLSHWCNKTMTQLFCRAEAADVMTR